ncbi:hypothetical protein ABD76_18350 [Paenibacillus dendritiformis]|uniref:MFS transporter n=1 Tax=Paenibacillus dendritiformis TaxID=130049 RepID=UPI0018CF50F7|nr:MFS transporter [Paenibacillus dendritiformis]MBG9794362.1 hypothetical protein [Paenibacillus dendritiformis]
MESVRASSHVSFQLGRFYAHTVLVNFILWLPMWIIFLQQVRGMNLGLIGIMQGVGFIIAAIAEVPAGAVADRYGRKVSLFIGAAAFGVLTILYGIVSWVPLLFLIHILWSVAQTFFSGTDVAFLYDGLKGAGREEEYSKIMGRYTAVVQGTQAAAALIGSLLANYSMLQPFVWSGLACIAGALLLFKFREPLIDQSSKENKGMAADLKAAFQLCIHLKTLRNFIIFSTVLSLPTFMLLFFFVQPYVLSSDISVAWVGIVILLLRLASITGAAFSHRLTKGIKEKAILLLLPLIMTICLAVAGFTPVIWGIVILSVMGFCSSALRPVLTAMLNRMIPSNRRATVLSIQSLLFTLSLAGTQTILSSVVDYSGFPMLFFILSALVAVTGALFLLFNMRSVQQAAEQHNSMISSDS